MDNLVAAKKLRLKTVMDQGQRSRKKQERDKLVYAKKVGPWLQRLINSPEVQNIVSTATSQFPGRSSRAIKTSRANRFSKLAKLESKVMEFTEYIGGPSRMYGAALYIVRDVAMGSLKLRDGKKKAITMAAKWYIEKSISSVGDQFEEADYDVGFRDFLPPKISFDLGPSREVKRIVETFGRQKKTWETMARKLAFIAENFNDIVREVKKDMRSSNDVTRLCALMTAITIETGLRPGAIGNAASVKDPATGEEIMIETFGVTTLQKRHVKFIRQGFAEFRFIGKMGTENVAESSDADILKALQEALDSTDEQGNTKMLFVTNNGDHVDDVEMRKYVAEKWGDISPTDFRKLKATTTFYEKLKAGSIKMRKELASTITSVKGKIRERIVARIMEVLTEAAQHAQKALSHDNWKSTTINTYVDPRIVVNFLNQGGLNDALNDILVHNKNVNLKFNFDAFVSQAKVSSAVVQFREKGESDGSAADLLDDMDDLVENLT